jgi:hypothetical protein
LRHDGLWLDCTLRWRGWRDGLCALLAASTLIRVATLLLRLHHRYARFGRLRDSLRLRRHLS